MTTQELINTYQLNFSNSVLQIAHYPAEISKIPNVSNKYLGHFLYAWSNPSHINHMVIPVIEDVLSGNTEDSDISGLNILVDLTDNLAIGYEDSDEPVFSIPLQDFYDIVVLWRDFLNEAPLNGTLVDDPNTIV